MAMQPVIKPQETKPAPLPAYPVAPSSQTQTSSRGMTPPKAYAGVPKSVPHYAGGTTAVTPWARPDDPAYWQNSPPPLVGPIRVNLPSPPTDVGNVDPNASPFMNRVNAHESVSIPSAAANYFTNALKGQAQSVSIPNAAMNYFARPANAQVAQPMPTISELQAAHRGAFAQAVFGGVTPQAPAVTAGATPGGAAAIPQHPQSRMGTPILNANPGQIGAPTGAPFTGTVARGGDSSLTPDPSGQYDVQPVGQPYASTPQQVALAAQHTGANAAALQNVAGAARDATGNPEQPQNMAAVQHAVANPTQYSPGNFVNLLRGKSYRQIAVLAGALRTAMPYNPQEEAYQQLLHERMGALQGMTKPQQDAQLALIERMKALRAGVDPFQKTYPMTDPNTGLPVDPATGQPVQ